MSNVNERYRNLGLTGVGREPAVWTSFLRHIPKKVRDIVFRKGSLRDGI